MTWRPILLAIATLFLTAVTQAPAQCEGDFNDDGHVTIEEIVTAVNNALTDCSGSGERACLDSGGQVSSGPCCTGTSNFPNTCLIGPCSCAPQFSHTVQLCACGAGRCFNGTGCVARGSVAADPP